MASIRLLVVAGVVLLLTWLLSFLWRGVLIRSRFTRLKANHMPIPEPYSVFFGHLLLMKGLREGMPSDAHSVYANIRLVREWQKFFPHAKACPPVIYLDFWPLMSVPFVMVVSPDLCAQVTQETPQPRHPMLIWAQWPLSQGLDLLSMNKSNHKVWRSRLNPGFSAKGLAGHMPVLLEETNKFAEAIKSQAGQDGDWGTTFTLYDRAIALTFDIIMRVTM
jgi:cytochrome P450